MYKLKHKDNINVQSKYQKQEKIDKTEADNDKKI